MPLGGLCALVPMKRNHPGSACGNLVSVGAATGPSAATSPIRPGPPERRG